MRDPRNWVRPAAAIVAGSAAARRSSCCAHGAERAALPRARSASVGRRSTARRPSMRSGTCASRTRRLLGDPLNRRARASTNPAGWRPWSSYALIADMATCYSPPLARDGGLVLELRPPDLSRLHDDDARGHALPRVRGPAHRRQDAAQTARRPELTIALIVVNVLVFLAEGHITLTGGEGGQDLRRRRAVRKH